MKWLEAKISQEFKKDKWEIKTLGEIVTSEIFSGNQAINHHHQSDGNIAALIADDVINSESYILKNKLLVNESLTRGKPYIENGDLLIVYQGFRPELLGHACAYLGKQPCIAGSNICVLKHHQNSKFLAYAMSSSNVRKQIKWLCKGGTRPYLRKEELQKIKVPLPDLETQNKIATILDKFLDLQNELKKEMKTRDTQYEYYKELISTIGISKPWID